MPTTRRRLRQLEEGTSTKKEDTPDKDSSSSRKQKRTKRNNYKNKDNEDANDNDGSDDEQYQDNAESNQVYFFDGVEYKSYQEMVAAKRKRNEIYLKGLGLLDNAGNQLQVAADIKKSTTKRGIKKKPKVDSSTEPIRSRRSSRISGVQTSHVALDMYVNNWNTDTTTTIKIGEGGNDDGDDGNNDVVPGFFKGRLNDGSDLSLEDAINLNESKWIHDDSVKYAKSFQNDLLKSLEDSKRTSSPTSVVPAVSSSEVSRMADNLSIDNLEWVAKVTPDRIYSVAAHPGETKLIACAGDKQGYVGLWDVDGSQRDNDNNGVHLFHVHSKPVCALEWMTSETMLSASYDGTVRRLDVERGTFEGIFATYDDSDSFYAEELGYGLDVGYKFWIQNVLVDHRYKGPNPCLFVATSLGDAIHLDLRIAGNQRITFQHSLSDKKINTLSLHPDGNVLASGGNDGVVRLWDIRKFGSSRQAKNTSVKPLAEQRAGLSVSSSYFSPSGGSLLTTSFADRLDLTENAQLQKGTIKPNHSIRHNNQTGRWLSTFMAKWHPELDIFVCGSMAQPRRVELFDASGALMKAVSGEALTAVASRCCFHPSTSQIIMIGGNSSGRVVAVR